MPHVFLDTPGSHLRSPDVALPIHGNAFSRARAGGLLDWIRDERHHLPVLRTADANAALPAVVIAGHRLRLGIGDVDHVVRVDVHAARTAELRPRVEELPVLVIDLNAVVRAIADEQPAARVHGERMRLLHLARTAALLAK